MLKPFPFLVSILILVSCSHLNHKWEKSIRIGHEHFIKKNHEKAQESYLGALEFAKKEKDEFRQAHSLENIAESELKLLIIKYYSNQKRPSPSVTIQITKKLERNILVKSMISNLNSALELYDQIFGKNSLESLNCLKNLSYVYYLEEEYKMAEKYALKVLAVQKAFDLYEAETHESLKEIYHRMGQQIKANEYKKLYKTN